MRYGAVVYVLGMSALFVTAFANGRFWPWVAGALIGAASFVASMGRDSAGIPTRRVDPEPDWLKRYFAAGNSRGEGE